MPIEFRCVQCGCLLRTPDESVGHQARCPQCGHVQPVPEMSATNPDPIQPEIVPESDNPYQPSAAGYAPTPMDGYQRAYEYALRRVALPATLLMVFGVFSALTSTCMMAGVSSGAGWKLVQGEIDWGPAFAGVQMLLGLLASLFIVLGASKMKNLEKYDWALLAAILAVLPVHGCCCFLLPLGIWAIVVLNDPYVRAAFNS